MKLLIALVMCSGLLSAANTRYYKGAEVPTQPCTQGRDFYLNTSTGVLYHCPSTNTWASVSSGAVTAGTIPLHSYTTSTALGTSANTQITSFSIADGTLAPGDEIQCRTHLVKTGTAGSLRSMWVFGGTSFLSSGSIDTANATHTAQFLDINILVTGTTSYETQFRLTGNGGVDIGMSNVATLSANNTAAITVAFQAWHTNAADTSNFKYLRCTLIKGQQ